MPVVACPDCAKKLNVPETAAGQNVQCPACRAVFAVPPSAFAEALETPSPANRPTTPSTPKPKLQPQPLPGGAGKPGVAAAGSGSPAGAKPGPSRVGFWIVVGVIGLLLGGAIFGLARVLRETP